MQEKYWKNIKNVKKLRKYGNKVWKRNVTKNGRKREEKRGIFRKKIF